MEKQRTEGRVVGADGGGEVDGERSERERDRGGRG